MLHKIEEIRKEAEALVKKQSWVRKGFSDLLSGMNEQVAHIKGEFIIHGKLFEEVDEYHCYVQEGYFLKFTGKNDAEFSIQYKIEGQRYENFNLERCAITLIRKCIAGIPDALDEILVKLKEQNGKYQEAVEKLNEMTILLA